MAQETEMGVKDQHTQNDHIGDDELSELQRPPSFYQKVREQAERFASTRLGQFAIERADRVLKLVEDTTKWSLPQEKNANAVVLVRPLPWVPFLLLIVMLRMTRIWLSVGALMIGNGPVSASDMISFIQTRRRKLRAIRVHGLRVMRHRQQEASSPTGKSFTGQISQWLNRAICRPGVQRANSGRMFTVPKTEQQQSNPQNQSVSKRPREEETTAEQNLTFDEMLNKYANENSEDDSDFVPNAEDESSSSSSSDTESRSSDEISSTEEKDINEERKSNGGQHIKGKEDQETTTSNGINDGNSNDNNKDQTEVAAQPAKEDEWSTPGHKSAALMKTHLYNNTAAAANTEQSQSQSSAQSESNPDTDHDPNNTDTETYSSSSDTLCHTQLPQTDDVTATTATTTTSEPNHPTIETLTPATSSEDIPFTVETLTPATSSEDVFYSPIGSPNNFMNFGPQTPLGNVTINSAVIHSTPHSDVEEQQAEEAIKHSSMLLHHQGQFSDTPPTQPQKTQQQQQQQQRQFNHAHQRYRGRNRR